MHRCFSLSAWTLGAPLTSSNRRHPVVRSIGVFYWTDLLFLTCTLRNWNPRPACGTAIKSVRISISVFGFAPTRDEPAECLPWTRRTGVCLPRLWERRCPQRTAGGPGRTSDDFCLIFGIPSWLMPLRDRSGLSSQPFWHGVRGRSGRSLFKVHWNLLEP